MPTFYSGSDYLGIGFTYPPHIKEMFSKKTDAYLKLEKVLKIIFYLGGGANLVSNHDNTKCV